MQSFDIQLMRLQYEILNVPLSRLASESGLSESMINRTIEEEGWSQWWPEEETAIQLKKQRELSLASEDLHTASSEEEMLAQQSEEFVDRAKKRLQAYTLAKEIYLAQKYLQLESALITKAHAILEECPSLDPQAIKQLSALYKDMVSKSPMSTLLSLNADESGVPNLIIRDLTGQ